jgi:hypothetical protein
MTDEEFKLEVNKHQIEKRTLLMADQMIKCMQHFGVEQPEEVYRRIIRLEGDVREMQDLVEDAEHHRSICGDRDAG